MNDITILIVEDDDDDFFIVERSLKREPNSLPMGNLHLTRAHSIAEARECLKEASFQVILLDLSLPDSSGLDSLEEIYYEFSSIPIVVLTGLDDEERAYQALNRGAQDYLVKGQTDQTLIRTIRYAIERNRVNQELEEARNKVLAASMAKSTFLANMSHEIRTPLTSILGFTEALIEEKLSYQGKSAVEAVYRNSEHLLEVINDILDLSKIEAGQLDTHPEKLSLFQTLSEFEKNMMVKAIDKNISLRFDYVFPLPATIHSDATRIKQILYNIVGNAIKFTETGGVVVEVSCNPASEEMILRVIDSGIGITEEDQRKLFKVFSQADTSTTRKFGGTGLGLVIAQLLAKKLGGGITLRSQKGEGSTFTIKFATGLLDSAQILDELPEDFQAAPPVELAKQATPQLSGRILIAEDCHDTQDLLHLILRKTGLEVEIVGNGQQVVEKAFQGDVDLILMDMQMPIMDGYTASQILRERGFQKPIIAFTASVMNGAENRCCSFGCNNYIRKPFKQGHFYEMLNQYLGTGEPATLVHNSASNPELSEIIEENPIFAPVILQFVNNLPKRLTNIESAIEQEDWKKLEQHAHKLAGAGNFGYENLGTLASALENAAETTCYEKATELIDEIKAMCARIDAGKEQLQALVGK